MLRKFVLSIVAVVLAGLGPIPARATETASELPVAVGAVVDTGVDGGIVWFQIGRQRRFLAPRATTPRPKAVIAALRDSRKSGRSVFASYDGATGQVDADGRITFVVRQLTYDGRIIEGSSEPTTLPEPRDAKEAAGRELARSVALRDLGRFADARDAIRRVLDSGSLDPRLHESALRAKAAVAAELAYQLGPEDRAEADELLVESLLALRGALVLSPGDRGLNLAMGHALMNLGAHEEALRLYEAVARAEPDEAYWPILNMTIVLRSLGRPQEALAALDAWAAENGRQDGMAFHYHRGWTLSDLGRYEEAIAEFTVGLEAQPDYEWALTKRACAAANLGRLRAALADQEQAVRLAEETVAASPGRKPAAFNLARTKAVRDILRDAIAKGATPPPQDLCSGYWPGDEPRRGRSSLLSPSSEGGRPV